MIAEEERDSAMNENFSDADLEAYLDEDLSVEAMAAIEASLRRDPTLHRRLAGILQRRETGVHSLAEVWRRHRLSCPDRETLGSFLLGVLDPAQQLHVQHHVRTLACRACQANLADLQSQGGDAQASAARQRRYFQSTAGRLH